MPFAGGRRSYKEIYLSPAWYGLVPDHNLGLMDPSGKKAGERETV
jgi:hypothetical protein